MRFYHYAVDVRKQMQAIKEAYGENARKYGVMCHKLPILVHTAGLAQALAQRPGPKWQPGTEEAYKVVFGDSDEAGYITFFDALYVPDTGYNKQAMYPDIITVHHPKYYQGEANATPSDWDSPTPIPLLSATGSYLIALAAPDLQENEPSWIEKTFEILAYALEEMGIGAKTSSGYGRMTLTNKEPSHNTDRQ